MKLVPLALCVIAALLFSTSSIPAVAGSSALTVTPSNLSPDQTNTLTINPGVPFAVAVAVVGPDGTYYESTLCTVHSPCTGDSSKPIVLDFGTGNSSWVVTSPPSSLIPPLTSNGVGSGCSGYTPTVGGIANTHCSGEYTYVLVGIAYAGSLIFVIKTASFSVPEFGIPAIMIAAIGLVLLRLKSGLFGARKISQF